MYKSKLTKDRAHAVADGNYEESDRLDALLLELEEKAEQLDQVIIRSYSKTAHLHWFFCNLLWTNLPFNLLLR